MGNQATLTYLLKMGGLTIGPFGLDKKGFSDKIRYLQSKKIMIT